MGFEYFCPKCEWDSGERFINKPPENLYKCPECNGDLLIMEENNKGIIVSDIDSHWDRGAYKTSLNPKIHKPIKPPEEEIMNVTYFVCRNCIYCAPYEYPTPGSILRQYVCKKEGPGGDLIENEELDWCGNGKWIVDGKKIEYEDIAFPMKEKDETD